MNRLLTSHERTWEGEKRALLKDWTSRLTLGDRWRS